jgi:hypothetical protein
VSGNSAPHASSDGIAADRRHQRAGFSIFVDQVVDAAGGHRWESHLYHAESGAEATMPGASPEQWIGWLLEHLGPEEVSVETHPEAAHHAVQVLTVEVLEVAITEDPAAREGSTHTLVARVTVQLGGLSRVEQEIGSRVLSKLVGPWRATDDRRASHLT